MARITTPLGEIGLADPTDDADELRRTLGGSHPERSSRLQTPKPHAGAELLGGPAPPQDDGVTERMKQAAETDRRP
jgi:hypothetical protein